VSPVHRFCGFELDGPKRRLRHGGAEVALQPRVLDLLLYLVRHRDRVVSKDELLEEVWEGAFVADGAVQRAVSLARAALREHGCEGIRTHPRQGYRFVVEIEDEADADAEAGEAGDGSGEDDSAVEAARAAFAAGDWERAVRGFAAVDRDGGLLAADLERWARAVELQGDLAAAAAPLERAVAGYAASGRCGAAAHAALVLANLQIERRESSVARGWHRRAGRYLEGLEESAEHAFHAWVGSRLAIFAEELDVALERAENALAIARRCGDGDVEALALTYCGICRTSLDDPKRGMALLDEAGAAVLSGNTGAWAGGVVFCGLIYSYVNRGEWRRAGEWTDQFRRWCETNGVAGFSGLCQLHRAEVLSLRGSLDAAEREVEEALEVIPSGAPYAEGDAHRLVGEIHLARGDLDAAEKSFRRAHALGWDPNPGYARLQDLRGRTAAAVRSLEASLEQTSWPNRQKRALLLTELVDLAARGGELEAARAAMAELDATPDLGSTPGGRAMVLQSRGELALAEGEPAAAARHLRAAVQAWRELPSPCNLARVRVRLARALAETGDADGADLELSAAEAQAETSCLRSLADQCRRIREMLAAREAARG